VQRLRVSVCGLTTTRRRREATGTQRSHPVGIPAAPAPGVRPRAMA